MFRLQFDDGEVACVAISGQLRQEDVLRLVDPLEDVLGTGPYGRKVLLDLSGLHRVDSSGFCWLVRCQNRIGRHGGQLILHSLSPWLGQVLSRLKMDLLFRITGDRESAIRLARIHGPGFQP